jgi:hypothetical protein
MIETSKSKKAKPQKAKNSREEQSGTESLSGLVFTMGAKIKATTKAMAT